MNLPPGEAAEEDPESAAAEGAPERETIDRQRLDEIFGDVLPDITSDERDAESSGGRHRDEWYSENRPPHHGG